MMGKNMEATITGLYRLWGLGFSIVIAASQC